MVTGTRFGILAGYDGSPDAGQALRWAAREAEARGAILTVCHSWAPAYPVVTGAAGLSELVRSSGEQILAAAVRYAGECMSAPSDILPVLASEPPAAALCQRSGGAEMTVVGSRGVGGLAGLLLGSVSSQVSAHAHGRVVVVRGSWRPMASRAPGPIVAGVDGSAASAAAAEFAFEEAALREAPLVAVCALADAAGSIGGARQVEDAFEQVLSRPEKANPDVIVNRRVTPGPPRGALLATASDLNAQLLVVGGRGRGGLEGMMLGSVSDAAVHHAPCPVAVVRPLRSVPGWSASGRNR